MASVLISTTSFGRVGRRPLDMLEEAGLDLRRNPHGRRLSEDEAIELLRGVRGLIAGTEPLNERVLRSAATLEVISRCGVGTDNVDLAVADELGIRVLATKESHSEAVAELTLAGILDLLRGLSAADRALRSGRWEKSMGRLLRGKTLGLVGLGRIGKALVRLVQPFELRLLAFDPSPDPAFARAHSVDYRPLASVLAESDIVSLHLPYAAAVHHLVDRRRLESMRPGAVLINCARGGLVDEQALAELLRRGALGGAYLDVFEREPYDGPLIGLDNTLLTPHVGSYAAESRLQMEIEAVQNLLEVLR